METSKYDEIIQWASDFLTAHPKLGWIIALIIFIGITLKWLSEWVPYLGKIKALIYKPIALRYKNALLAKKAMSAEIKGKVNSAVKILSKEMPKDWIKPVDIIWQKHESKQSFLNDGKIVLRMRPFEEQEHNFVTAVYQYCRESVFPKTRSVVPEVTQESIALQIARRIINSQAIEYKSSFEDEILEPAVSKNSKILDYLPRYETIDNKGFFTGPFIREINEVAYAARFDQLRKKMSGEATEILKHIEQFIEALGGEDKMPVGAWFRHGPLTSYGFLLVAHPGKIELGVSQYVNRASEHLVNGVERLYIFGSETEKGFAKQVINSIQSGVPAYELSDEFETYKDYRGRPGGVGALFVKK